MHSLTDLQARMRDAVITEPGRALLESIVSDRVSARSRLEIHRNHYRVSLKEGLAEVFPATVALLGERCFHAFTDLFIRTWPPEDPCLANYGSRFSEFLLEHGNDRIPEFVAEVTELEWILVALRGTATTKAVPRAVYQRAIARFGGAFGIRLAPVALVRYFRWPVHRIRDATLAGGALETLSMLVEKQRFTSLLLYRDRSGDPCQMVLDRPCDAALRRLRAAGTIIDSIGCAHAIERGYPIAHFLAFLVDNDLVTDLVPLSYVLGVDDRDV